MTCRRCKERGEALARAKAFEVAGDLEAAARERDWVRTSLIEDAADAARELVAKGMRLVDADWIAKRIRKPR